MHSIANASDTSPSILLMLNKGLNILSGNIFKFSVSGLQQSKEKTNGCAAALESAAVPVSSILVLHEVDSMLFAWKIGIGEFLQITIKSLAPSAFFANRIT